MGEEGGHKMFGRGGCLVARTERDSPAKNGTLPLQTWQRLG